MGLGFNFGSQDKGLGDSIKTTSKGLGDMSLAVGEISSASARMAFKPPNLGPAVGMATSLASDMKLTTTNIEAFGVASSKVTSAALAGLNQSEKQFKAANRELTGAAFSMNMDVGKITQSFVALKQSQVDIKKVGFRSLKEYQKFIEVTGVDSTKFAGALGRLTNQMGFSSAEAGDLVKATAAIGKKFNIGREAVQGMADTVQLLNENSNLLPENWGPERTAEFVKGATKFAGALTSVGLTADEAMKASQGLTSALLKGETGLANLYSGVNDTMPGIATVMTKHLGNAQDAFAALEEDPATFMQNMGGLVDEVRGMDLDPKSLNMFRAEMENTFGKDSMAMFTKQGMGKMGPALEEASKPIKGQDEILQDLAKRYKDGRTAAERFAIAQDRLLTKMKNINGVMSDQEYLKKYKKNTNELHRQLAATAAEGGPLGTLTTKLIEARVHGIGGMLSSQSKWGMALAELSNQFAPILKVLPGIGAALMALMSPIALITGAVAGLYFVFKDLKKGSNSIVRPWIDKLKSELPKIMDAVKNVFSTALGIIGKVIEFVVANIPWKKVVDILGQGLAFAAQLSLKLFKGALDIGGKLLAALGDVNWSKVGNTLGGFLGQAVFIALETVGKIIMNLPQILYKAIKGAIGLITGLVDGIVDHVGKKFPVIGAALHTMVVVIKGLFIGIAVLVASVVIPAFASFIVAQATAAVAFIASWALPIGILAAVGIAIYALYTAFMYVADALSGPIGAIKDALGGVLDFITGGSDDMLKHVNQNAELAAQKERERHKAWVSDQHAKGVATKGFVKTHEGVIIKSSDAIVQYVKTETGEIKAMVKEANKMSMANITHAASKEAKDMWTEYKAAVGKVQGANKKHSAERDRLYADYQKKRHAYEAEHGVDLHRTQQMNILISNQMAIEKDLMKGAEGASKSYTASVVANQSAYADAMAKEAELINQRLQAGAINEEQAKAEETALLKRGATYVALAQQTGDIIDQNFKKVIASAKAEGESMESMSERVSHVYAENFKASTDDILAKLPEKMSGLRDEFKTVFDDIAEANKQSNKKILLDNADDAVKAQELIRDNNKKYLAQQATLVAGLETHNRAIVAGSEDGIRDVMAGIKTGMSTVVADVKVQGAEAAGEIQKTIGVSADEAAKMVGTISNLKPKKFKKNMKIISGEFKKFLELTVSMSKTMMEKSAEYINTYWESAKMGWEAQTTLVQAWSETAEVAIKKYWTVTVTEAGKAAMQFVGLVARLQVQMQALAKSINLMDLLASPSQVDRWASQVVSALAIAFRGGKAADAMMGAAYNKALAMSAIIQSSSASPEGGDGGSTAGVGSHATANLIRDINNPRWAEKDGIIPSELREMNESLLLILAATGGAEPEITTESKGRRDRTTNRGGK